MAAYDRDATLERRQIREISLNVARRLHQVLDRTSYIPAALRPEVEQTARVITGIQRDIDQIMAGLPTDEALDFAILTHIMGGQRHALDLLEILEEKLAGGRGTYQRDSARVHQALLAVSREIERDALRYAAEPAAVPSAPAPGSGGVGFMPPAAGQPGLPQPPPPAYGTAARRPPGKQPARQAAQAPGLVARLGAAAAALVAKPVPVAVAALAVGAGLVVAAQSLLPSDDGPPEQQAATDADRDTGQNTGQAYRAAATPLRIAGETTTVAAAVPPSMEQPYLVVLTTRRSTEELQQDYRAFKGTYPELLGNAKARVDRVQGQDRKTWYRLSLIPPRTRDEAKTLCSNLRQAGLTGCWIRPVPVN